MKSVHKLENQTDSTPANTPAARTDRIELRATGEEKRLLTAAAAHQRLDVTSFILRNVLPAARCPLPAARDVVGRSERIMLFDQDTALVLNLLEDPPKPTAALLAAARRRAAPGRNSVARREGRTHRSAS